MLETYGWSDALQRRFAPYAAAGHVPGRVILQQRNLYGLATAAGEIKAEISGNLARDAPKGGYPVAGDWVAFTAAPAGNATIHQVLDRRTAFVRTAAGSAGGLQVVAANVDVALLMASLNADFNPRRLERYLAAAWRSGAAPVVLLTKADLCDDVPAALEAVTAFAGGAPVHALSSLTGAGLAAVWRYLTAGTTAVMVGSSGAGKSTLANVLLGAERMATQTIREADGRGRHTTSHRELLLLPGGGLLLDTPGMREIGIWDGEAGVAATFADIDLLAAGCRFGDCGHSNEPGCAVRAALAAGELDEGRWLGFQKLRRELAVLIGREDPAVRAANKRQLLQAAKADRARTRRRGRD